MAIGLQRRALATVLFGESRRRFPPARIGGVDLQATVDLARRVDTAIAGQQGVDQAEADVVVVRLALGQAPVDRRGGVDVASVGQQPGQRHLHLDVGRITGDRVTQLQVGLGIAALAAGAVGELDPVADHQLVERGLAGRVEILAGGEIGGDHFELGVLAGAEQQCRVLGAQRRRRAARVPCRLAHRPAHVGDGARRVLQLGPAGGQRRQQFRIAVGGEVGIGEDAVSLARLATAQRDARPLELVLHPGAALQRHGIVAALGGGEAFQAIEHAGPVFLLGIEIGLGEADIAIAAVAARQAVEQGRRLGATVLLAVDLGQIEADPGIGRRLEQRIVEQALAPGEITGIAGLLGTAAQLVGAQGRDLRPQLGRRLAGQLQRFGIAAAAAEHGQQHGQRVGVLVVALEDAAGNRFRLAILAAVEQHVGMGETHRIRHFRRRRRQRRPVGGIGSAVITGQARLLGGLHARPEGRRGQRLAPAAGGGRRRRARLVEIVLRFLVALLAQPHHADAAERIGIAGAGLEDLGEAGFGTGDIAAVGLLEQAADPCAVGGIGLGPLGTGEAVELAADLGVLLVTGQPGAVALSVGGLGFEPDQRLALRFPGLGTDTRMAAQRRQLVDAFATGPFAIGQVLGQRQRSGGIGGVACGVVAQPALGRLPAGVGGAERLVVLQRIRAAARLAAQSLAIGGERGRVILGSGGGTGTRQCRGAIGGAGDIAAVAATDHRFRLLQRRRARRGGAQTVEILARADLVVLACSQRDQATERLDIAGIGIDHALPGLAGAAVLLAAFPVATLLDQRAERRAIGLGLRRQAVAGGSEQDRDGAQQ